MSTAGAAVAWHDLLTMMGGASAALAGLIFVAVSVNHEDILHSPALAAALAARALGVLAGMTLLYALGLAPGQWRTALGTRSSWPERS